MSTPGITPMVAAHMIVSRRLSPARTFFNAFTGKTQGRSVPSLDDCFERVGRFGRLLQRVGVPDDVAEAARKRHELKLKALYQIEFGHYERDYMSRRKYTPDFAGFRKRMEDEQRFNRDFFEMYRM